MRKNVSLFVVVLMSWYKVFGLNCKPKDCIDLKCYRVSTANGGVIIYPMSISFTKIEVTCKQTGKGGGWIVFMRRFDGSLSFRRTWDRYKGGFGDQGEKKDSWLGNENVYQLIKSFASKGGGAQLRIEAYGFNGTSCVTTLDKFVLKDETDSYMLLFSKGVSSHSGVVEDWKYSNGTHFATFDHTEGHDNCFKRKSGGWWLNNCHHVYFTGHYRKDHFNSTNEFYVRNFPGPLKAVDMLFRPMKTSRACYNPCKNGGTCEYLDETNTHRCVCPEQYCGAKCEKDNPCKNNGTCVYSLDTKKISCVCVHSGAGIYCGAPETGAKVAVIAFSSLLVVLVVGGIATWMILNRSRRAKHEEYKRLLAAENAKEGGWFAFLFS